jgi:hypothetical protein
VVVASLVAAGVVGVAAAGVSPVVISTLADENNVASSFGDDATATYGQTVTAPAVAAPAGTPVVLTSFSFRMNLPAGLILRGFVYAWDGTKATGPELFQSAPMHTNGSGMETITFTTPEVPVVVGLQYVIFASISLDFAADIGQGNGPWGLVTPSTYPDGSFVFLSNAGDSSQWTTTDWNQFIFVTADAAFSAAFAAATTATTTTTTTTTTAPAATPVPAVPSFTG